MALSIERITGMTKAWISKYMAEQIITWTELTNKWNNYIFLPFAHITMKHVFLQFWMVALPTERT